MVGKTYSCNQSVYTCEVVSRVVYALKKAPLAEMERIPQPSMPLPRSSGIGIPSSRTMKLEGVRPGLYILIFGSVRERGRRWIFSLVCCWVFEEGRWGGYSLLIFWFFIHCLNRETVSLELVLFWGYKRWWVIGLGRISWQETFRQQELFMGWFMLWCCLSWCCSILLDRAIFGWLCYWVLVELWMYTLLLSLNSPLGGEL